MASWIFSAMGIANCIGRVFFGKLVDAIVSKYGDETVVYVSMAILTLNGLGKYIYYDHIILILPHLLSYDCKSILDITDWADGVSFYFWIHFWWICYFSNCHSQENV